MKLGLKWGLPGDISGGLMIFGIMFTIAIIELYVLKATQALTVGSLQVGGARGGAPPGQSGASTGGGPKCQRDSTGRCVGELIKQ